eukprot:CAMPEP_0174743194 /NCGR_PEP_ID=MMETSP1094-20130205/80960_1 /TAXON_ID=156173 /ORGANISM="Chrysochromulina brevifilum, Strain UTEX LB 985" /LENGTH=180 /DNA_ID=CAMNT_0015947367 /DNA_START=269 /DNA_END=807 /DNA_ORIENTATION=-
MGPKRSCCPQSLCPVGVEQEPVGVEGPRVEARSARGVLFLTEPGRPSVEKRFCPRRGLGIGSNDCASGAIGRFVVRKGDAFGMREGRVSATAATAVAAASATCASTTGASTTITSATSASTTGASAIGTSATRASATGASATRASTIGTSWSIVGSLRFAAACLHTSLASAAAFASVEQR